MITLPPIYVPSHLVERLQDKGWDVQEIQVLLKLYIEEQFNLIDSTFILDFEQWLTEWNEEELGKLF